MQRTTIRATSPSLRERLAMPDDLRTRLLDLLRDQTVNAVRRVPDAVLQRRKRRSDAA